MKTLTYRASKLSVEKKTYKSKEDMQMKLDVFLIGGRITQEEYEELTTLLNAA